ncbi:MAG: GspE/PulE family protein [Pirellulaceae bacterium]|nr:GspE/PulE family protein [Pirellulaceae bacterium]
MSNQIEPDNRIDAENEPVDRTAAALIQLAIQMKASDLFFLTNQDQVEVRLRQMGIMRTVRSYSLEYGRKLMSHFKAMSNIDITERFRPLEGRWVFNREEGAVDLRLNCMPTLHGEDITCRILDRQRGLIRLDELSVSQQAYHELMSLMKNPSGLILVSGPTGSGKTTTLYSCLQELNNGERKINTLEDPIEYVLDGIRQSQVNIRVGVDFPELLAACLRQAPDVIMIGEIRDAKTAKIAVRAANSGHLVLATLHAPVAASAAYNLLSYGVNPHFLASSLLGIISQRLLRRLCANCKVPIDVSDHPTLFQDVRSLLPPDTGKTMYAPGKCEQCYEQGYDGLLGVCEVLGMNDEIRKMMVQGESMKSLHEAAVRNGMLELRRSALLEIAVGSTTTEEMFRCIPFEFFDD